MLEAIAGHDRHLDPPDDHEHHIDCPAFEDPTAECICPEIAQNQHEAEMESRAVARAEAAW